MYATTPGAGAPSFRLSARDQHVWALFADWCAATNQPSTPATPHQLARFLHDNPAPATQRRRVSVINTAHRRQGHPAPGSSEEIRRALNTARAARLERLSALVAPRITQVPVTGWPAGLFGRRDALILVLAAAGVGFEQIARLRRRDVTVTGDNPVSLRLTVIGDRIVLPAALDSPEIAVATIYRRWTEVLGFLDRNHGATRPLADHFKAGGDLSGFDAAYQPDDRPLLTSINRWGHTPLIPAPLTARAITTITQAHLSGRTPAHTIPQRRARSASAPTTPPIESDHSLDPRYYERGIEARRDAHQGLSDVTDLLDDIEDRADQLLAELLGILDKVT
ncbi:hypothetical protein SIM91_18730 [Rhodococcus opacus]|uniref:hypothetical protein n=1 Tax=Rhodococcus opacus TaxID=37919 RepID=UPI0002A1E24A|nr:hypothetical protein [Rhodococcus opacus]ELB87898.1 hypothetical protein Rwratislav_37427 [Rhodococcus wratislaviensis IFP 2016]MDX5965298.1 hypothetical protein [Rhodococcus opacus]NKY76678.1 hypothetical protein [Rhodococcus opacus]CAG7618533.1 hypothetical protein E143388_06078 [Rhodococcus opacus]